MPHCHNYHSCKDNGELECICNCKICSPELVKKAKRQQIPPSAESKAVGRLKLALARRLKQKGRGTFASTHEVLGIVTEEYTELVLAVQSNDRAKIMKELEDIAVACVFAFACDTEGGLQW